MGAITELAIGMVVSRVLIHSACLKPMNSVVHELRETVHPAVTFRDGQLC